jgi:hypothetical protein
LRFAVFFAARRGAAFFTRFTAADGFLPTFFVFFFAAMADPPGRKA